jgi:hypothetical protein
MFNNKIKESIKELESKTRTLEIETTHIRATLQKLCKHEDVEYICCTHMFNVVRYYRKCNICEHHQEISEKDYNRYKEKLEYNKAKRIVKEYQFRNGIGEYK